MAKYTIQAPNGKTYTIEGPSGASQEDVQNEVLRQHPDIGLNDPGQPAVVSPAITPPDLSGRGVVNRGEPAVPSRTVLEQTSRLGGMTAKGLAAGVLAAPGELAMMGARGIDWAARQMLNSKTSLASAMKVPEIPASSEFLDKIDVTGAMNQLLPGGVAPENALERAVKKGAEVAGGVASTGGAAGLKGAALLSKAGGAALGRVGMVGAGGSLVGEGVGAVNPTAGVVAEVLTNLIGGPKAAAKITPKLVTSEQRFKEAHDLYEQAKNTGTVITGKSTSKMVDELRDIAGDRDLLANKPAHSAIDYLAKHSGDGKTGWIGIDLGKLMQVRRDMRAEAVGGGITQSKESKRIGHYVMNRFDELVDTMTAAQLHVNARAGKSATTGKFQPAAVNGKEEVEALKEGMILKRAADMAYRQASKAKLLEDTLKKAETLAGGTLAERYRLKMGQLIRNDEKFKQFSKEEQEAIRAYHSGSKTQKVVDFAAKMSPARGGMVPALHMATALSSGGASLPLQAIGGAAHMAAGSMSKTAQQGMMQRVLGAGAPPTQPWKSYLPDEDTLRAGMLSGQ